MAGKAPRSGPQGLGRRQEERRGVWEVFEPPGNGAELWSAEWGPRCPCASPHTCGYAPPDIRPLQLSRVKDPAQGGGPGLGGWAPVGPLRGREEAGGSERSCGSGGRGQKEPRPLASASSAGLGCWWEGPEPGNALGLWKPDTASKQILMEP